ncbi:hypothetical protein H2201_001413 [Coniosporium apollinis]|uniref:Spherulation-specific family 4 n=1 Tax=Coniosporium apollinis TaxID=61459 RepID=A0ABQ9P467_9PEZI|nr:hypothetical protein H2201_001413 [Coniosporium apollinis]
MPRSEVIFPLYIYPAESAWDPFIEQNRGTNFTLVINPASGPGVGSLPDANYTRELTRLNTQYQNVRCIGYVATTYGMKDIEIVEQEIATYAGWGLRDPSLAVAGVFLDETPWQYSPGADQYFQRIRATVSSIDGLLGSFIVHNPGAIPDPRYSASADVTVVFEETYQTFIERRSATALADVPGGRGERSIMIHSVPAGMSAKERKKLVQQLRSLASHLFVTDLSVDYYSGISPHFGEFVSALD